MVTNSKINSIFEIVLLFQKKRNELKIVNGFRHRRLLLRLSVSVLVVHVPPPEADEEGQEAGEQDDEGEEAGGEKKAVVKRSVVFRYY